MKTFFWRVLQLVTAYPVSFAIVCLMIIVQLGFRVGAAFCYQQIFDQGIHDRNSEALYSALGLLVLLLATFAIAATIQQRVVSRIGSAVGNSMRQQLFDKILALSPDDHQQHAPSTFVDLMGGDTDSFILALVRGVPSVALDVTIIVTAIAALFFIEWRLALVVLAAVPFTMMAARPFQQRANALAKDASAINTQALELTQDAATGHIPLLIFHAQEKISNFFTSKVEEMIRIASLYHFHAGTAGTAAQVAAGVTQLIVIGFGGWLALHGDMTGGLLVAFVGLLINISDAVGRLAAAAPIVLRGAESLARIDQRLALPDAHAGGGRHIGGFKKDVRFVNVSFSYPNGTQILRDVSFTVPANSSVALIGPSGSGKSTVLSLLMRIRQPSAGRILIDEEDMSDISEASLRNVMTAVPQMPLLLRGTVRDNIEIARAGASSTEIEAAARAAAIHDVICAMPQGYDSPVGDGGSALSGGQRQRIALARAFLRKAPIILLDEATSALDPKSQRLVNRAIAKLHGTTTVMEVTHKVVELEHFDQILVFDQGKLVQRGTHASLIAEPGLYAELHARQHGFEWDEEEDTAGITVNGLRQLSFFAACSDERLSKLAASFLPERQAENRVLFHRGDPGERFYIIVQGSVEILRDQPGSPSERIAVLRGGDFFGEMALVRNVPRGATVRTLTDCQFITLHRVPFLALLNDEPQVKLSVMQEIERRAGVLKPVAVPS